MKRNVRASAPELSHVHISSGQHQTFSASRNSASVVFHTQPNALQRGRSWEPPLVSQDPMSPPPVRTMSPGPPVQSIQYSPRGEPFSPRRFSSMPQGSIFAEKRQPLRPIAASVYNIPVCERAPVKIHTSGTMEQYSPRRFSSMPHVFVEESAPENQELLQIKQELVETQTRLEQEKSLVEHYKVSLQHLQQNFQHHFEIEKAQKEEYQQRCQSLASALEEEKRLSAQRLEESEAKRIGVQSFHEKELNTVRDEWLADVEAKLELVTQLEKEKVARASEVSNLNATIEELNKTLTMDRQELARAKEILEEERADAKVNELKVKFLNEELMKYELGARDRCGNSANTSMTDFEGEIVELKATAQSQSDLIWQLQQELKQERSVGLMMSGESLPEALKEANSEIDKLTQDNIALRIELQERG